MLSFDRTGNLRNTKGFVTGAGGLDIVHWWHSGNTEMNLWLPREAKIFFTS